MTEKFLAQQTLDLMATLPLPFRECITEEYLRQYIAPITLAFARSLISTYSSMINKFTFEAHTVMADRLVLDNPDLSWIPAKYISIPKDELNNTLRILGWSISLSSSEDNDLQQDLPTHTPTEYSNHKPPGQELSTLNNINSNDNSIDSMETPNTTLPTPSLEKSPNKLLTSQEDDLNLYNLTSLIESSITDNANATPTKVIPNADNSDTTHQLKTPNKNNKVQNTTTLESLSLYTADDPPISVRGSGHILSNFSPTLIRHMGRTFKSVEVAYQYQKAVFFNNAPLAQNILLAPTPHRAKALASTELGKIIKPIKTTPGPKAMQWLHYRRELMFTLLKTRSEQDPIFENHLKATSRAQIIHTVPDKFWGTGSMTPNDPDANGLNYFGFLLMKLRTDLLGEQGEPINQPLIDPAPMDTSTPSNPSRKRKLIHTPPKGPVTPLMKNILPNPTNTPITPLMSSLQPKRLRPIFSELSPSNNESFQEFKTLHNTSALHRINSPRPSTKTKIKPPLQFHDPHNLPNKTTTNSYIPPTNTGPSPGITFRRTLMAKDRPWNLALPKLPMKDPILIADSNGRRIDPLLPLRYSVLSFCGGKFETLAATLRDLPRYPDIPVVLTLMGINNRQQNFEATSKKCLQRYIGALKLTFPSAKYYFTPIICDPKNNHITQEMHNNISDLNKFITEQQDTIPIPPYMIPKFEMDGIHLTSETMTELAAYFETFLFQ